MGGVSRVLSLVENKNSLSLKMRDIPSEVKRINQQLIDHFGIDTSTGQPIWRVVWSDDQYEMRRVEHNDNGVPLIHSEVREMSRYPWIQHKWVLEQLVVIPYSQQDELPVSKLSYEPMFPFQSDNGEGLPANFDAAKFVIDCINSVRGKGNLSRYKEDTSPEAQKKKIDKLQEELFGDENDTTDALAYGEGVGYTGPSKLEEN